MAAKTTGVELIISAKDESEKAFAEITDALKELEALSKKGIGFKEMFAGADERLDSLSKRLDKVGSALEAGKGLQKTIDASNKFIGAMEKQAKVVEQGENKIAELAAAMVDIETAANQARTPSEKLTESLSKQQAKFAELGGSIGKIQSELQKYRQALTQNEGLDAKALESITNRNRALAEAGKAWRETSQQIAAASKVIKSSTVERDTLVPLRDEVANKIKQLRTEIQRVQSLSKSLSAKANRKGASGEIQAFSVQAQTGLARLREELKSQVQIQSELDKNMSASTREIEKQTNAVERLSTKAASQKGVFTDLKNSLGQFVQAAKGEGIERQTKVIDKLEKDLVKLQSAYDQTSAKIVAAQRAINEASTPDPRLVSARDSQRKRIQDAVDALTKEKAALDAMKVSANQAGVSVTSLNQKQQELDRSTEALVAEKARLKSQTDQLAKSQRSLAASGRAIGNVFLNIGKDSRQSLGFVQRLRGELLSIAATYTGLYAVGGAIRSIYDVSVLLTKAEARFGTFFDGDTAKIADEIKFVRSEADRLAVSFEGSLDQYSKFVTGIPSGVASLKEIRAVFTGLSTAARGAGLSNDELERSFKAVTQIFSKSQVQMEELKGQLGDALPGAIQATADALGIDVKSLVKQVELGNVSFEAAILLADQLAIQYGKVLPKALSSPAAAMTDLQNTFTDLKIEMGETGFIATLTESLREIVTVMKTPEFKSGAQTFARQLGNLAEYVVALVKNIDSVVLLMKLWLGYMATGVLLRFGSRISDAGTAMIDFGKNADNATGKLATLISRVGRVIQVLPLLGAALGTGLAIGTYLNDQSALVRKFGATLVSVYEKILIKFTGVFDKIKAGMEDGFAGLIRSFGSAIRDLNKMIAESVLVPPQFKLVAQAWDKAVGAIVSDESESEFGKKIDAINAEVERKLQQTDDIITQMFADIDKEFTQKGALVTPDADLTQLQKKSDEARAIVESMFTDAERAELRTKALKNQDSSGVLTPEQLKKLEDRVIKSLTKIDAEIQAKTGDTLETRLDAIRAQYATLLADIEKVGGTDVFPLASIGVDQIVAIKQIEQVEREINDLTEERRKIVSDINTLQEVGAITVEDATTRIGETNARILPQMNDALTVAREISREVNSAVVDQSLTNQENAVARETELASREQLKALETQINAEMEIRSARIQTINAELQAGLLDEYGARLAINEVNAQTSTQLDSILAQSIAMAQALGDTRMVESLKQVRIELKGISAMKPVVDELGQSFASGLTGAIEGFIRGTQSAKDAFRSFVADFLTQIARAIVQALILKAITGSTGGGAGGAIVGALTNHTGGVVGMTSTRKRVPMTAFAGAVRYHNGGVAGLKPNEIPTILERGEEVMTKDDPRHRFNGGAGTQAPMQVKIVNAIDSASVLSDALNTSSGQKSIVNAIMANKSSIRSVLA
jgi:tape measure domain-containing protein